MLETKIWLCKKTGDIFTVRQQRKSGKLSGWYHLHGLLLQPLWDKQDGMLMLPFCISPLGCVVLHARATYLASFLISFSWDGFHTIKLQINTGNRPSYLGILKIPSQTIPDHRGRSIPKHSGRCRVMEIPVI